MSAKKYTILLTACINPGDMIYTSVTDADIRRSQYMEALSFYLNEIDYPVVFVENTGTDISDHFERFIKEGRLEYLAFNGNEFDKKRGKGYGEAGILEYAVCHSSFLQEADFIIKVTGRLKVLNIISLIRLHSMFLSRCDIQCILDLNSSFADSRLFIVTLDFLQNHFLVNKESINDSEGVYLEHVLFDCVYRQAGCVFYPFFLRPRISGISGTSGQQYWDGNYFRVKLRHLHSMLDCSSQYNHVHKSNSSRAERMVLKAMSGLVGMGECLLDVLKRKK